VSLIERIIEGGGSGDDDVVLEVRLGRVMQHFAGRGFLIISAFRGERTRADNLVEHERMRVMIRAAGYGYTQTQGAWPEKNKETGETRQVTEYGYLIPQTDRGTEPLLGLGKRLNTDFEQEGFVYVDPDGARLYDENNKVSKRFTEIKTPVDAGAMLWSRLRKGRGHARIKFRLECAPDPGSQAGYMVRQAKGEIMLAELDF